SVSGNERTSRKSSLYRFEHPQLRRRRRQLLASRLIRKPGSAPAIPGWSLGTVYYRTAVSAGGNVAACGAGTAAGEASDRDLVDARTQTRKARMRKRVLPSDGDGPGRYDRGIGDTTGAVAFLSERHF